MSVFLSAYWIYFLFIDHLTWRTFSVMQCRFLSDQVACSAPWEPAKAAANKLNTWRFPFSKSHSPKSHVSNSKKFGISVLWQKNLWQCKKRGNTEGLLIQLQGNTASAAIIPKQNSKQTNRSPFWMHRIIFVFNTTFLVMIILGIIKGIYNPFLLRKIMSSG